MLFNSIPFLIFFPIVAVLYYLIPKRFRYLWLLGASYYFYMCWNASYALLLLFSTGVTYACGLLVQHFGTRENMDSDKSILYKKLCVGASLVLNLGILFTFKYFNFFLENLNRILSRLNMEAIAPSFSLLLPVGISFYIFQALSYTIDVYRGEIEAEKNFFRYALFVSFFPQLVAGPIERSKNLLTQLRTPNAFKAENVKMGLVTMLWGYFLKLVIADRIAMYVDEVYGNYPAYPGVYLLIATILFAFQIYCDFYGYSTIAIGAARVMGFKLMENFSCPYLSTSISGFWRNWHISLTSWFKDYLYIPLGGNRKGRLRKYINLMIVFTVSGLWHGASWTFIIWGMLNGFFQVIGDLTAKLRSRINSLLKLQPTTASHKIFQVLFTFTLVDFTWIFFRANSITDAKNIVRSILTVHNYWILNDATIYNAGLSRQGFTVLLPALVVLFIGDLLKKKHFDFYNWMNKQELWFRWVFYISAIAVVATFGIWGTAYDAAAFIYFQF